MVKATVESVDSASTKASVKGMLRDVLTDDHVAKFLV